MVVTVAERARELGDQRRSFVRATVVRAQPPASARPGDEAIVREDGSIDGFVGGVCAEGAVRTAALGTLRDGGPVLLRVLPEGDVTFPESPGARVVVNPCLSGGALEIFLEPQLPPPLVDVVGRTPVADAVVAFARQLGYATTRAVPGELSERADSVIVASHGRDEGASLRAALEAGVPHIALVASPRRGAAVLDELGLDEAERARVSTPAGFDLGARTAPEIALSIVAELVAALRSGAVPSGAVPSGGMPSGAVPSGEGPSSEGPSDVGPSDEGPSDEGSSGEGPSDEGSSGEGDSGDGASGSGAPFEVTDPVCGMSVTVMPDTPHLSVDGEDFRFCATGCRDRYAESHAEEAVGRSVYGTSTVDQR